MPPNYHGLALLLSIGSLPLACSKENNASDDGTTSAANTTTVTDTSGATDTTADPTASDSTVTTGTQPTTDNNTTYDITTTTTGVEDTGTTTPQPTTFLTTDSESDTVVVDTEDLPPPTDPFCLAYANKQHECFPRYAGTREYLAQICEAGKAYGLMNDGQPCSDAIDTRYVCLSNLDCADFKAEGACDAELQAAKAACPSLFQDPPDTDT